jgi:hypothetical protein
MKRHIKKYLVPHEDNDHQPHMLRDGTTKKLIATICAIELVILVLILPSRPDALTEKINNLAAIFPSVLVEKTNKTRTSVAMNELAVNETLVYAAQLKANDMAEKGYFAHNSPDGKTPWDWLEAAGYSYQNAGENLAVNFVDSSDVHNAWLNSPTHKANIVREGFEEIGIATAEGTYKGKKAIFVAQFFGRPMSRVDSFAQSESAPEPDSGSVAVTSLTPQIAQSTSTTSAASTTPTEVLGAEIETVQESFATTGSQQIAVQENDQHVPASTVTSTTTMIAKVLSSPKTMLGLMLWLLAGLIALALFLKVFVKVKIQYPPLIVNGVIVLLLILFFTVVNQYLVGVFAEII